MRPRRLAMAIAIGVLVAAGGFWASKALNVTIQPENAAPIPPIVPAPTATVSGRAAVDLKVTGPGTATLRPEGGGYRGLLTITVQNRSRSAFQEFDDVYVTLPTGVNLDFDGGRTSGFNTCGTHDSTPTSLTWVCYGTTKTAPLTSQTYRVALQVDAAPGPEQVIDGFKIRVDPRNLDPDPADNTAAVRLVLAAG